MSKRLRILLFCLPLLSGSFSAMDGQGTGNGCSAIAMGDIAAVMKVDVGTLRLEATEPDQGHTRCVYKSMERVVGATDALAAELAVDLYLLPSTARAEQQLARLGAPDLLVRAEGSNGAVALGEQVGLEVNREPGFALRHDARITVMQMSGSFMQERPAGWAYAMQALGLRIAGAQVQGPLFADACDVVPRAQLQTLVTLQPATLTPDSLGSMSNCTLTASSDGSKNGSVTLTVRHYADADRIKSAEEDGQPGLLAHGSDPGDAVFVPAGVRGKATAVHGTTLATVEVREPDVNAIVSPSYAYRVQRAALQAAGATVQPSAQAGAEPVALAEKGAAPATAMDRLLAWWNGVHLIFWLPVLVVGGLVGSGLLRAMTRKRLMTQGLTAVAKITGVSDTGVTVNNRPRVRYDVVITMPSGESYVASTTALSSRLMSPASLIGTTQTVRVDPRDPQSFVFANQL